MLPANAASPLAALAQTVRLGADGEGLALSAGTSPGSTSSSPARAPWQSSAAPAPAVAAGVEPAVAGDERRRVDAQVGGAGQELPHRRRP